MALFRILFPPIDTAVELLQAKAATTGCTKIFLVNTTTRCLRSSQDETLQKIDMSFGQFLENNGLSALTADPRLRTDGAGIWLDRGHTCILGDVLDHAGTARRVFLVDAGRSAEEVDVQARVESVWDTIVKVDKLEIRYNTEIGSGSTRPEDGKPIMIVWRRGLRRASGSFPSASSTTWWLRRPSSIRTPAGKSFRWTSEPTSRNCSGAITRRAPSFALCSSS